MTLQQDAKPVPHPTDESKPYWDAADQGRLRLQRCDDCGKARHYPQLACAACCSLRSEWFDAAGVGTVYSWTIAHHPFHPAFRDDLPYVLATIDLAEGVRLMGRFPLDDQAKLRIGLPVTIAFVRNEAGVSLPVFTPA